MPRAPHTERTIGVPDLVIPGLPARTTARLPSIEGCLRGQSSGSPDLKLTVMIRHRRPTDGRSTIAGNSRGTTHASTPLRQDGHNTPASPQRKATARTEHQPHVPIIRTRLVSSHPRHE